MPQRPYGHEMRGAAGDDEQTKQQKDVAKRDIFSVANEVEQHDWDREVRDRNQYI